MLDANQLCLALDVALHQHVLLTNAEVIGYFPPKVRPANTEIFPWSKPTEWHLQAAAFRSCNVDEAHPLMGWAQSSRIWTSRSEIALTWLDLDWH